jgi:hypothetical protein
VSKRTYGCFHRKANFPTEKKAPATAHLQRCTSRPMRRSQTF